MTKSISLETVCAKRFNGLRRACRILRPSRKGTAIILQIGILTVLVCSMLSAQIAGKISGTITDPQTGEPLIGANVMVLGTSLGASTDVDGTFFIINIPAGKYNLQASMIGYERIILRDIIVNSGRTTIADFKIKSAAVEQEAVVIEHERPDVERERTSTGAVIRPDDIQQLAGMQDLTSVIGMAADVTDGHFRGGREGEELYTLHGMGIVNPLDNTTGLLPIMSAVEEVEVITSGFGAQYGNAQSGVVNISMREGKSDKWRSFVDVHTRLPGRKHFGGSIFDPNANPYLRTLSDTAAWYSSSQTETGMGLYTKMGAFLTSKFGRDTALQVLVAHALWEQQRREMGNSYGNKMDYSVEFSTGGPIDENMRMFIAVRNNVTWPFLPTEHPDNRVQVMGNVVSDIWSGATLRLSGTYAQNKTNYFPSLNDPPSSEPSYYNWLWDRISGVQYQKTDQSQLGFRLTATLSQSTFLEFKTNILMTHKRQGSAPYAHYMLDTLASGGVGTTVAYTVESGVDDFSYGKGSYAYQDEQTKTYSVEASMTSQVTKSHLLNAGIQSNFYAIAVNNIDANTSQNYDIKPLELSVYVQDKMEFEGMIANVGLRWDMWNENAYYNPNIYSPYRIITSDSTISYSANAQNVKAPIFARLQPRVGVSFPVSINTVFHLNYGAFMQRPSFQYVLQNRVNGYPWKNNTRPHTFGNPTLKPQTTYSYDVGVLQGLGEGFTLDVSGYYKDVNDLIQQAQYSGNIILPNGDRKTDGPYYSFVNRDYADIRGFHIALNKRKGNISLSVNYQYSVATGKSGSPANMAPSFTEGLTPNLQNVMKRDVLLDFDREHNLTFSLAYLTDHDFGFKVGQSHPLGDVSISINSFARSGRPFSYEDETHTWQYFNYRTPAEYNTDMKISKKQRDFFGVDVTFYLEVLNLFDNKILNYDYLFSTSTTVTKNNNVYIYMNPNQTTDSPGGIRYINIYNQINGGTDFGVDQSFLIYSNQPRSFNIGVTVEF